MDGQTTFPGHIRLLPICRIKHYVMIDFMGDPEGKLDASCLNVYKGAGM